MYLHGAITAAVAWAMLGWHYWLVALVILVTHTLIDGWKSYQSATAKYFLIEQAMHILIIIGCWYFTFKKWNVQAAFHIFNNTPGTWKTITAFVFLTTPAGILIGQLTKKWRDKIPNAESLAHAGEWIGIVERIVILIFVLQGQYSAISLLVAAKGIIRFNEKDRLEIKTEYLVVGTLMSIGLAIITGMVIKL